MNGFKVFSKLEIKWGYHQLELSPESRENETFATPDGLFQQHWGLVWFGLGAL